MILLSEPVFDPIASGYLIQTSPKRLLGKTVAHLPYLRRPASMYECAECPRAAANRHSHEEI